MGLKKHKSDETLRHKVLTALGDAIKAKRRVLGLTQEQLAANAGLDRAYVGAVERGERNISVVNLYLLAEALKTQSSVLLDGIDGRL
jgi:transcriptional regulator with XRE-family HTH domain